VDLPASAVAAAKTGTLDTLGTILAGAAAERLLEVNADVRRVADGLAAAVGRFCNTLAATPYRVERHIPSTLPA
jgi:hypothetical protein